MIELYLPKDMCTSAMVDYGSRASAKTLTEAPIPHANWKNMMLYGWIEFDGVMFLQENDIQGIHELLGIAEEGNGGLPIHGFSLNHWRTSENRTTIRYVSEALIDSTLTPEAFYAEYARALGIADAADYAKAMQMIDDNTYMMRRTITNCGFPVNDTWSGDDLWLDEMVGARQRSAIRQELQGNQRYAVEVRQGHFLGGR